MNKIYIKLIAMALALVLSASVMVMSSYAWFVLSGNPVATGIQVAIGGGNTILTAPNMVYTAEDGNIYHIPGFFSDRLNFGMQQSYTYLQEVGNLTPVSTSNGIDWFLPAYYDGTDPEVQQGRIPSGALKDISAFTVDSELTHANISKSMKDEISEGSYIYLDFWVVAPGGDYQLRVSTGDETSDGGSFVIDLLEPEKDGESCTLGSPEGSAAAAVRIGFLANDLMLIDDTMWCYERSPYFDDRFTSLRGLYQEPNSGTAYLESNRFTIYEPNGDYHPEAPSQEGRYVETKPLSLVQGKIVEANIRDRLTVQKQSAWTLEANGESALEQQFQTALRAMPWETMSEDEIFARFYGNYFQGQISPYVDKGDFVPHTGNLYANLGKGYVSAEELTDETHPGATGDVSIITLERNVPQRIRMFIWLEGQDMDCVDSVNSARFAVNIELAGGSVTD